jgi:hypothetical protein
MLDKMNVWNQGKSFNFETNAGQWPQLLPRFSLIVMDHEDADIFALKTMAVFVVPLGLEREM